MKTNKLIPGILLISLCVGRPLLAQTDVKEQLIVPLSDPGKPGTLKVQLINGSINVVGYSGKEVVIDIVASSKRGKKNDSWTDDRSDRAASGMKRISPGNALDVSAQEKNNFVSVETNSINQSIDLTIKVPQQFHLRVSTINHGEITVENVIGELEVNNVNGAIDLNNISGPVVANTVNGAVKVTFKRVNSEAPMAFSTLNGNVDVTFPATAKMNLKLKSDHGDIYSDFDMDVDKSQSKVDRTSQNGMYRVSIDDWVRSKVNGGGREIMMKNMSGNIYVRKAK